MARYRVQGPDGAIHVFEGPEEATPEQVQQFAAQTFGGRREVAQAQPKQAMPDDPGAWGSLPIAAGKTVDSVLDGLTQMYLGARGEDAASAGLKANVEEKRRLYQPLQEQHPVATAIGEALPGAVIPAGGGATLVATVGRLAAAGAIPGALEYGTVGERAGRAATGAAGAAVGGVVIPKVLGAAARAVPAVGRTAKAVVEPLFARGREAIAGRTLNNVASADAASVMAKLNAAAPLVPGSLPTAAQVAENGGIAALERSAAAAAPADFATRFAEQAAARSQALRGIAGDDAAIAAAQAARKTATKPLYDSAASQVVTTVDPTLRSLLARPSVQKAIARAEKIAAEDGRAFGMKDGASPSSIDGRTLQDLKMGLDALLKDPTSGIAGNEARLVEKTREQLMGWMEGAIPELGVARQTYAKMSKPINQMQVGQRLLQQVEPALADHGAIARETASKYALALRNADQTARAATKFKGAGMADIMTPEQMATLNAVAQDLARKSNAQDLGRGAGSDTFQKMAMSNIAARSGAPRVVGGALAIPGVSKVAKFLYQQPEEQIQSLIAQSFLDPKLGARLMQNNPAMPAAQSVKDALLANPARLTQLGGGAAGLSIGNFFAQ